ncbi:MAG: CbtA family protein [Paracoccaceae bacterium]|nr:CbtA family protein [Paracoccaceae bacterium]
MLASALIAGFAAGLLAALLHFAFVQELILLGEQYETGALTHFAAAPMMDAPPLTGTMTPDPTPDSTPNSTIADHGHDHASAHTHDGADTPALTRNALTVLFAGLVYVAYGLILVAGFGLAEHFGKTTTARTGLLWGIAGFATFQLAPAMGLAPELPGTIAAELGARQFWWWGTVAATGTALALLAYGRGVAPLAVAALLLAAPHVIGAPQPDAFWGAAPPEVAAAFSARVLGAGLAVWAVLGGLAGKLWHCNSKYM